MSTDGSHAMQLTFLVALAALQAPTPPRVHSISDLSQEFTFYMDGRFHAQYLKGVGRDARNWGSLHRLDLSNTNLLLLEDDDPHVPYSAESIAHVDRYVREGGTVLLMADGGDPMPPGEALLATIHAAPYQAHVIALVHPMHEGRILWRRARGATPAGARI